MITMGAAKKHVSYDTYPDSDEHKNRAANIMLSTNSKRMVAKKQNERVLRRKFEKKKPRLTLFRALVIAFILGILCVGQYGIIQDMGLKINESRQTLDDINATNEALKQQSAALGNRNVVREKAQEQLGMQEAENVIVYTPTNPQATQSANAQ